MINFEKERDKRILRESTIELCNTLKKSRISNIIYLPDVDIFSIAGSVGEQLVCVGLILSQLCRKTGKEIDQLLDKDFYNIILPGCKRILEKGKEL